MPVTIGDTFVDSIFQNLLISESQTSRKYLSDLSKMDS